eukprot:168101_1
MGTCTGKLNDKKDDVIDTTRPVSLSPIMHDMSDFENHESIRFIPNSNIQHTKDPFKKSHIKISKLKIKNDCYIIPYRVAKNSEFEYVIALDPKQKEDKVFQRDISWWFEHDESDQSKVEEMKYYNDLNILVIITIIKCEWPSVERLITLFKVTNNRISTPISKSTKFKILSQFKMKFNKNNNNLTNNISLHPIYPRLIITLQNTHNVKIISYSLKNETELKKHNCIWKTSDCIYKKLFLRWLNGSNE